jgi:hypothetical protein
MYEEQFDARSPGRITVSPSVLVGVLFAAGSLGFGAASYLELRAFPMDRSGHELLGRLEAVERELPRLHDDIEEEARERERATRDQFSARQAAIMESSIDSRLDTAEGRLDLLEARINRQSERLSDLADAQQGN